MKVANLLMFFYSDVPDVTPTPPSFGGSSAHWRPPPRPAPRSAHAVVALVQGVRVAVTVGRCSASGSATVAVNGFRLHASVGQVSASVGPEVGPDVGPD